MVGPKWLAAVLLAIAATSPASATCTLTKIAEIPVTMVGRKPIVTAKIDGRDARFILDSGAFFSTISEAAARQYGLRIRDIAPGARLRGIGSDTSLRAATANTLTLAGLTLPKHDFVVGGSDTGETGLIGQDVLGYADVEYDLPHGVVRLMRSEGCSGTAMAYWAGSKPAAAVTIEPMDARQRHTVGVVKVDGRPIRATFDSGASRSSLTGTAARRLGISPTNPGAAAVGYAVGMGQLRVPIWRARFQSIDLGGEAIARPWIDFGDRAQDLSSDMLIGIDVFLTHRIYVDNRAHRLWLTYEGGPVFGLDPKGAVDDHGVALDLTDRGGEPTDAAGFARRGALRLSRQDVPGALADLDHAVALAPDDPDIRRRRAAAHTAARQPGLALADLDAVVRLRPGDGETLLDRARLRLVSRDRAGALADARGADAALPPTADRRLALAGLFEVLADYDAAIPDYDRWLDSHPEDHDRAAALNGRCWARAVTGRELDRAERDCASALRLRPDQPNFLDSRALVRLRQGAYAKAIADYDASIPHEPRNALSRYLRAIAERRLGDTAKADADRDAALAINPLVAHRVEAMGLAEAAPSG